MRSVKELNVIEQYADSETVIADHMTVVATRKQVSSKLGEEAAILHLEDGIYYGLNSVGARVWQLAQSPIAVEQILSVLLEEYEVEIEQCRQDLHALLRLLAEKKLIEISNEAHSSA